MIVSKRQTINRAMAQPWLFPICMPNVKPSISPMSINAAGFTERAAIIEMPKHTYKIMDAIRISTIYECGHFVFKNSFFDM